MLSGRGSIDLYVKMQYDCQPSEAPFLFGSQESEENSPLLVCFGMLHDVAFIATLNYRCLAVALANIHARSGDLMVDDG